MKEEQCNKDKKDKRLKERKTGEECVRRKKLKISLGISSVQIKLLNIII